MSSMRRKQGFNGCLKIASFLNRFLKHFGLPKIGLKSVKTQSSGSSWAKMAPRRCHLEPIWLQEPIFIDFSMILEWISQVYFDRYCDEVEIEFGFVLPRGRKDAKLRSSEGMKARSRAQNGIRSHIRGSCSKSLCSLTLHSVAHRSALPCSVHGYARVHTSIYIYNFNIF